MGDRYYLDVKCKECGHIEEGAYYAPTSGFLTTKCPKCGYETDLEKYSGIDAESTATTEDGVKAVRDMKESSTRRTR